MNVGLYFSNPSGWAYNCLNQWREKLKVVKCLLPSKYVRCELDRNASANEMLFNCSKQKASSKKLNSIIRLWFHLTLLVRLSSFLC